MNVGAPKIDNRTPVSPLLLMNTTTYHQCQHDEEAAAVAAAVGLESRGGAAEATATNHNNNNHHHHPASTNDHLQLKQHQQTKQSARIKFMGKKGNVKSTSVCSSTARDSTSGSSHNNGNPERAVEGSSSAMLERLQAAAAAAAATTTTSAVVSEQQQQQQPANANGSPVAVSNTAATTTTNSTTSISSGTSNSSLNKTTTKDALICSISQKLAASRAQCEAPPPPPPPPFASYRPPAIPMEFINHATTTTTSMAPAPLKMTAPAPTPRDRFYLPGALEAIQRWLFTTGGDSEDISAFLTEYAEVAGELGVPVDRVFVGGLVYHPTVSAYVWKWEKGVAFDTKEISKDGFYQRTGPFGGHAPFLVLMDGTAQQVRIRSKDGDSIPQECVWLFQNPAGYQDYFALPVKHRGEFKGAVAWCTKKKGGFNLEHLQFFEKSMSALSTIIRTHTNDLVMSHLVGRLRDEVDERTEQLAKANQNLAQANRRIVHQSQAQLRHFAMMSHEIRTPLGGIIGLCSLLEESPLNDEQKDLLQTISKSGDLLQRVVDDVLDYSKLAAGRVEIDVQVLDLRESLEPVIKSMSTKAKQEDKTLRVSFEGQLSDKFCCDGRRLQQILYNLIGNAIKFSHHGGLVEFVISGSNEGQVKFVVRDFGKGIAKQNLSVLFQPFSQAHGEKGKLYGGTGLGLAITSKLVHALGGTISVDSELGRWTEFNVNLPCNQCPESSSNEESTSRFTVKAVKPIWPGRQGSDGHGSDSIGSEEAAVPDNAITRSAPIKHSAAFERCPSRDAQYVIAQKRSCAEVDNDDVPPNKKVCVASRIESDVVSELEAVRILVAEDNKVNQKLITRVLHRIGVSNFDLVENGAKAVQKTKEKDYDLVLMDVQMPKMDGLQATRTIKKRGGVVPKIVFVSAHAVKEIRAEADEVGGDGFIAKPYNLNQIRDVVVSTAKELQRNRDEKLLASQSLGDGDDASDLKKLK